MNEKLIVKDRRRFFLTTEEIISRFITLNRRTKQLALKYNITRDIEGFDSAVRDRLLQETASVNSHSKDLHMSIEHLRGAMERADIRRNSAREDSDEYWLANDDLTTAADAYWQAAEKNDRELAKFSDEEEKRTEEDLEKLASSWESASK